LLRIRQDIAFFGVLERYCKQAYFYTLSVNCISLIVSVVCLLVVGYLKADNQPNTEQFFDFSIKS
jgi:ABC-type Fe3+ transport system permease subunit